MSEFDLESRIAPAVEEVLETMFFSSVSDADERDVNAPVLAVRVPFNGEVSGVVEIRISQGSARTLAASFLGDDVESLNRVQIEQMACELANMICGAVVSKPDSGDCLRLGSPELLSSAGDNLALQSFVQRDFSVENGTLSVLLFTGAQV